MAYGFDSQLAIGEHYETVLDRFFRRYYEVEPVSDALQHYGIDRIFINRMDGKTRWAVEYKADFTAPRTGNAFIEIISVDVKDIPGWAYTSIAQKLIYYVPELDKALVLDVSDIKERLGGWLTQYEPKPVANRRGEFEYQTFGVCVPLTELESHAKVLTVLT